MEITWFGQEDKCYKMDLPQECYFNHVLIATQPQIMDYSWLLQTLEVHGQLKKFRKLGNRGNGETIITINNWKKHNVAAFAFLLSFRRKHYIKNSYYNDSILSILPMTLSEASNDIVITEHKKITQFSNLATFNNINYQYITMVSTSFMYIKTIAKNLLYLSFLIIS